MKIPTRICMLCGAFLMLATNIYAQDNYPFWPSYNQTPIEDIIQPKWVVTDHIIDGWDWSLPPGISPAPMSKLIFARNNNLSQKQVDRLPSVNFSCNPVVTYWLNWKDLEPTIDNYKWTELKTVLDGCKAKGYKSVIRIMTCRVERSAPVWMRDLSVSTKTHENGEVDFDPADPTFHEHYLDLVADFGASGIPARDDVVGLFVGYSSKSWGDEGIGPIKGESDPSSNDGVPHVIERLDAWAAITDGFRDKMVMGGYSNHGFSLGFGIRRGFVEHYMYHTPDNVMGQLLDANKYMYVDEDNPIIANNLYNGEENEEYEESWVDRFGPIAGYPYRYFSSNIRLLQMRTNAVLYNPFTLMPEMLAWVGLELGRTREDAPDAWCFLRETYIRNGVNDDVKNFERWLYQRDTPGYETQAVIPVDKNYNSWMYDASSPEDYIARKGAKIGFAVNDVVFPTDNEHNVVAIKVSYIDNVVDTLKLVYHNSDGPKAESIVTTGGDVLRTATFLINAKFDASGFDYDFEIHSGGELPVSFVRVIKTGIDPVPPGEAYNPYPPDGVNDVSTDMALSWTAGSNVTAHHVYLGTDSTLDASAFQGIQSGVTFDPNTLQTSTTYYWRVDQTNPIDTTMGTVWRFTTESGPLAIPDSLSATAVSISQIDLSWSDNSENETGFGIERSPDGVANWMEIASVAENDTAYSDSLLNPSTTYFYRLRALKLFGYSDYSSIAHAKTMDEPFPPTAPGNLVATPVTSNQIDLTWDDNSPSEDWSYIERSDDGITVWSLIDSVSENITAYSDPSLASQTLYFYRVRASNQFGLSSYTNIDSATTLLENGIVTYLSDLPFTEHDNGWGPVEINRSNGHTGPDDGDVITINGVTYEKGLGCHAYSKVSWNLAGLASTFLSDIGVDDEVEGQGSIVFEVHLDSVIAYTSEILTWEDDAVKVSVDITGVNLLELIITDGGDGGSHDHGDWADARVISSEVLVGISEESDLTQPREYSLSQNYPNPFKPTTNINFSVPGQGQYSLRVFNILGKEVTTLVNGEINAGSYKAIFDASNLSSGIYFYSLTGNNVNITKKMILME